MYKVFLTVRNRLEITKMCITALVKHSELPYHLYVYDNLSDVKLKEHFALWHYLFEKKIVKQVTFTSIESTFGSFSKVVTSNLFGFQHTQDPDKMKCDFLVLLDNDIIVTPGWDTVLYKAWQDITKLGLKDIKIISQLPGGITCVRDLPHKIAGVKCKEGKLGGSGLWCVQTDFFDKFGFLDVRRFRGLSKGYDQTYWGVIETFTGGKPYILGLDHKLGIHCGSLTYSVCNSSKMKVDLKKMEEKTDVYVEGLSFEEFYNAISTDETLLKGW